MDDWMADRGPQHEPNPPPAPVAIDDALSLAAVPIPLLLVDSGGTIAFTNPGLDELFGYDSGVLAGQPVEVLIPPDVAGSHRELRDAYAEVPYERTMGANRDVRGITRQGEEISVEIALKPVEIDGVAYVLGSVIDIGVLRAEQEKTRLAIDASASAMIMFDADGTVVLANRQALVTFGYAGDGLVGRSLNDLLPDRYRRRHAVFRAGYMTDPTQRSMGDARELYGLRSDGSEFPLELGLTPIDDQGKPLIMATIIDITQRKASEDEIRRQNADLVRLNDELGQFAYSASHDLKAPLATLDGLLDCLRDDLADGTVDGAAELAVRAQELTRRLATLIEGVLGFARSEHAAEGFCEVHLGDFVETMRTDLGAELSAAGVRLDVEIDPTLTITADPHRLRQIVENLMSNAIKYCDRRNDGRFVAVRVEPRGEHVELTVADNGIGIPAEAQAQVFTMFRRFANHSEPGTGLGLAMVKRAVDQIGGEITFESAPGASVFRVLVPRVALEPTAAGVTT
ncbi:MAG: sensor histidine kinase [Acidimicrobiales bacterium]